MRYVNFPEEISENDLQKVGGKAFNLAKMLKAGFPVPECFFVNVDAYHRFLEANNLLERIIERISRTDFKDINSLTQASKEIKSWIIASEMPEDVKNEIVEAYRRLAKGEAAGVDVGMVNTFKDELFVAVRSSAVTEDIGKASAAGQQETFLNVRGALNVVEAVKRCWASLFTPRAIYYREQKRLPHDAGMGVVVQRMVNSEKSGVMFTLNPANPKETNVIVIEAVWGLGETIVQGEVTPDTYVVDKQTGKILEKKIGKKLWERIRDVNGKTVKRDVPAERVEAQVLSDKEIVAVAAYGKKIEEFYGRAQDIEFAIERGKIYIVQARPVTFLAEDIKAEHEAKAKEGKILLKGMGASPGIATGRVKVVRDLSELGKIEKGDILVTEMTSPDYVPAMEKSAAIVTDRGGLTCHAAIVSRELGIPCIVGTENATQVLKDGMLVTVDANHGVVYEGSVEIEERKEAAPRAQAVGAGEIITATKVKVNLAFPETATEEVASKADGVGLLRIEHMLTRAGMHPVEYIRQGKQEELVKILEDGIGRVASVFFPKPVWVRSLDARTDEFRHMQGGEKEPEEANPMLGWHGIRRSIVEKDILLCEFEAVKRLHARGLTNVHIMLPFVISVEELRKAKKIAKQANLPKTVKMGIMVETPAATLTIEEFCEEGIDFISFGTNDLTQLTLGVDRNNERLAELFNPFHRAVLKQLNYVIEVCKEYGVETSICGEAGSNPRMAEILVEMGISSISANIDALDEIRRAVARKEREILLDAARKNLSEQTEK